MKYLLLFLLSLASHAQAMTAICGELKDYVKQADIIFIGTVTNRERRWTENADPLISGLKANPQCGAKLAKFRLEETLKGTNIKAAPVIFAGDSCLFLSPCLQVGERHILFSIYSERYRRYVSLNTCANRGHKEARAREVKRLVEEQSNHRS